VADDEFQAARKKVQRELGQAVERNQLHLLHFGTAVGLFVAGAAIAGIALLAISPSAPAPGDENTGAAVTAASFAPPAMAEIPAGPEGEAIKRGMAIFDDPRTHAAQFVGNAMACKNCHLDSGRRANSSPMWAAWVSYPQYRKKNNSINTMEDRIEQCFRYSMNAPNSPSGAPPPRNSNLYRDLESYFRWLATGAPTGTKMKGAGYPKPELLQAGYDPARGAQVFQQTCTACHGTNGQGAQSPDGKVVYPPLWGPRSYNWGAGMARVDLAAGFIKANMPFDRPGTLTDQQAWDVAAFIDSHERPRDPRQTGTVAENAKANFAGQQSYYGKIVQGKLLGTGVSGVR
jgi:thiosulfate dehydrogenase